MLVAMPGRPSASRLAEDADAVAALVRCHAPLSADAVEPLGAGTDSVAWRVDSEWVARFPLTPNATATLEREASLAPLLASRLPVPVPSFDHVARLADGTPVMSCYRLLDGVASSVAALAALPSDARAHAMDNLAAVLVALRGVPGDTARDAGARLRHHEGFGHPSQRELHHRHAGRLAPRTVAQVETLWRAYEHEARSGHAMPALAHNDLKPEHVLHDPLTGRLTGILDWGDAGLSHPWFDLAVIGLFFDHETRDEVARRTPGTDVGGVASAARLLVAVRWLCDLDVEVTRGDEAFADYCVSGLIAHLSE